MVGATVDKKQLLLAVVVSVYSINIALSAEKPDPSDWQSVAEEARGQTVYFNAWGGETRINRYIGWVSREVKARYEVTLQHVKLTDTAQAVSRILAEKQAGNMTRGAVDLLWLNGENFAALKQNDLLFGPWAEQLPNFSLVDADQFPEMREDFTVPVEGLESPWTRAQLVFYYDSDWLNDPPGSMRELLQWSTDNPGEFIYPRPPAFLGTTFLKQAILELVETTDPLYVPVDESNFDLITAPLWIYLDELHPSLLRAGRFFPAGGAELRRFLADGEISLAFSFSPGEAVTSIANGELPPSTRSYVFDQGTIGNVSFLAIPFNAQNKAAAMLVANFLLSPEAQARAHDPVHMGSSSVLSLEKLSTEARAAFDRIEMGIAAPSVEELNRKIQEPHPSWMPALEQAWLRRYTAH
ncbi:MAG: ABC transporter substrate-binding protein [Proteobacteria bacterium]|nr:ABC transporter substrate-binding protein [Pseudomonadota bacterium]